MPRLLSTPAVWREAVEDGERYGYADASRIRAAQEAGFVERYTLESDDAAVAGSLVDSWNLGHGESETLAVGTRVGRAVVDDGRAARVAEAIGVEPISTLFLPVLGVERGLATADAIALLRRLAVVMSVRAAAVFAVEEHIKRTQ